MRTVAPWLMLICLRCLGFSLVFAADGPAVMIRSVGPHSSPTKEPLAPLSFFGDQPSKFDAEVAAPLGSHLDLHADLFQTANGGVSAILLKNIPLCPPLLFDKITELTAPCTFPALPALTRPTKTLLKIYARIEGQPEPPQPLGVIDVFVYPRPAPAEWKKIFASTLAAAGLDRLALFGSPDALRHFLQHQQVPFDDMGSAWPAAFDARHLYVAVSPPSRPDASPSLDGIRIILFNPDSTLPALPGVYPVANPAGGAMVKVTLPGVAEHLDDDPRSQRIFLEIVHQALNPQAPVEDSTATWP